MRTQLVFLLLLTFSFSACSQRSSEQPSTTPSAKTTVHVDPATAASITGVVKFAGAVPRPQKIDMALDPACGNQPAFDESLVVNNGDLVNVFVYVKDGPMASAASTTPPIIEQRGCRYHPHILGVMAGQSVKIINADETTHNIHPMPKSSKQWNESQLPKGDPIVKTFSQPELMIPVKCNQHPWMRMYVNVVSSPYFAVTGPDGKFEIRGLPPGDYTLAAVHEKLGEQDVKISLGSKESKTVEFSFKGQ